MLGSVKMSWYECSNCLMLEDTGSGSVSIVIANR